MVKITTYAAAVHRPGVRELPDKNGWEELTYVVFFHDQERRA